MNDARFDFILARGAFFIFSWLPSEQIDSVSSVIRGGSELSKSLDRLLFLVSQTEAFIAEKSLNQIFFTNLFVNLAPELRNIEAHISEAKTSYESISWLPSENLFRQKEELLSIL